MMSKLIQKNHAAIARITIDCRPLESRQVTRLPSLLVHNSNLPAQEFGTQQHLAIGGYILEVHSGRPRRNQPPSPSQINRPRIVLVTSLLRREPNFTALGTAWSP